MDRQLSAGWCGRAIRRALSFCVCWDLGPCRGERAAKIRLACGCPLLALPALHGDRSSMVELQIVILAVAGSSPVGHPRFQFFFMGDASDRSSVAAAASCLRQEASVLKVSAARGP
jgi:hypothetical protein